MLRLKYLNKKINEEGQFLMELYRANDSKNKKGKQLALKIEKFLED